MPGVVMPGVIDAGRGDAGASIDAGRDSLAVFLTSYDQTPLPPPSRKFLLAGLPLAGLPLAGLPLATPLAAQVAGVVNGDTVWLELYSREVGRRVQLYMQTRALSASDVLQSTWLDMVDDILLWQEVGPTWD